ncbi:MAG: TonB-dependent receptor [Bacteroidota bacterium]|nr:TonB-dependent receptor [Bacteroidota bacterium]
MNEDMSKGSISFRCAGDSFGRTKKTGRYIRLRYSVLSAIFLVLFMSLNAGNIAGTVYSLDDTGDKAPLSGAYVCLPNSQTGTVTDATGQFTLKKENTNGTYLIASFEGFSPDTIPINRADNQSFEFVLKEGQLLKDVVVTGTRQINSLSKNSLLRTEVINKTGLMKMACCNLSESFENSATVTVGFTDAVSGAKQVQLLGLSGIYIQLLGENIPMLRGLSSANGWSYIPGSWLESIQLSKGTSSVVNGYEAISGQLNLEFKKPDYTDPLFVNLYTDQFGCSEGNITAATQVAPDLWTGLLVSGTLDNNAHDYNKDGFLDMPKTRMINVYNRWLYLSPNGLQSRTGIKFLYDDRQGGHDTKHNLTNYSGAHYVTNIDNRNFTVDNKTGFPVGTREGQSIGIITGLTHQELNSSFGLKTFNSTQVSFYSNVLLTSHLGSTDSPKYTIGGSFVFDGFKTHYQDLLPFNLTPLTALNRQELVPGFFGEYTYSLLKKFTLIVGARTDYNSKYGWLFTPRTNIKYNITDDLIARASAGKGYRAPNVIADNMGIMASSRKLYVDEIPDLAIENAWNYGGNLTWYVPIGDNQRMSLSLDYFHTEFHNQAVVDIERNSNSVYFYNLKGRSYADAWQADLSVTPFNRFDIYAAFRFNNTKITYSEENQQYLVDKPLTARYRGLLNLSYATKFRKWVFDFTTQMNGPSRIPCLNGYNSELKESPGFTICFAQVTKNTKRFDVYLGAENILDYKQNNPIIDAGNPFDQGFESSFVWGPVVGRKIYAGIRLRIGKLK